MPELTPYEAQVTSLWNRGLSSPEIGERLGKSKGAITHALAKARLKGAEVRYARQAFAALAPSVANYAEMLERRQERADFEAHLLGDPCAYCGRPAVLLDHVVPESAGGDNTVENLTASCQACNAGKQGQSLLTYLITRQLYALRRLLEAEALAWRAI